MLSRVGYQRCLDGFGSALELNGRCEIAHGMIVQWGEILAGRICIRPKILKKGEKKPVKQISLCSPFGYTTSVGVQPTAAACKNLLDFSDGHRENEV